MNHSLRITATLKDTGRVSLDSTLRLDDDSFTRLHERLMQIQDSPIALAEEHDYLRALLNGLAAKTNTTRDELTRLYDFKLELK